MMSQHPPTDISPLEKCGVESYESLFAEQIEAINGHLDQCLTKEAHDPFPDSNGLWEAMRYGTLNGGKRIRAVLALETCLAVGGKAEHILPTASAIELVHAQSLMHDDLPCMDNDDLRRGKPSVHKAFSESTAVLAGDALIALAFGIISRQTPLTDAVKPGLLLEVIGDYAEATSIQGLVNGQYVDILYENRPYTPETLHYIHTHKTGALFRFATRAGARLGGASAEVVEGMTRFGQTLGLAFQIVDDLLDIESTPETLGKTTGKDQKQQKATYPACFGIEESRAEVARLAAEAHGLLDLLASDLCVKRLRVLVGFITDRLH